MRDEVGLLAAEDGPLGGPHAAQLQAQDDDPDERDQPEPGGRQRHDALCRVQVVHAARVLRRLSG